jgi:hypothetical protein
MEGVTSNALIEPQAALRFGDHDRTLSPRADTHQRAGLMSDMDVCHQPLQVAQRPAKNVRHALLPTQTFKVVGAKVKLHD